MNLSKKQFSAIIAIMMILATVSITFAVLYFTRNVSITAAVAKAGRIHMFEEDGETEWTSLSFRFTPGSTVKYFVFFVNNTGNTPVYVDWNISYSNITWVAGNIEGGEYFYGSPNLGPFTNKYILQIWDVDETDLWSPNDSDVPESLYLNVDQGQQFKLRIACADIYDILPETFELTLSFYAEDS